MSLNGPEGDMACGTTCMVGQSIVTCKEGSFACVGARGYNKKLNDYTVFGI